MSTIGNCKIPGRENLKLSNIQWTLQRGFLGAKLTLEGNPPALREKKKEPETTFKSINHGHKMQFEHIQATSQQGKIGR